MSQVAAQPDLRFRDSTFRRAIIGARDAAQLEEWRAPLVLGHLVVCNDCDAFRFGANPAGLGHCSRYDTEAAPFCPFQCPGIPGRDGTRRAGFPA